MDLCSRVVVSGVEGDVEGIGNGSPAAAQGRRVWKAETQRLGVSAGEKMDLDVCGKCPGWGAMATRRGRRGLCCDRWLVCFPLDV